MLFRQELIQKIVSGQKTQTRPLVKPKEEGLTGQTKEINCVYSMGRTKWEVGRSYAVQCKRGGKGIWCCKICGFYGLALSEHKEHCGLTPRKLRITLTRIRRQKLLEITKEDAKAEGFKDTVEFLEYFKKVSKARKAHAVWNPDVWALSFEVKK